jgi:hypothetical protein
MEDFKIEHKSNEELMKKWGDDSAKALTGMQIKATTYLSPQECKGLGWDDSTLAIELTDPEGEKKDIVLFASQDDEGNGAGALFTTIPDLPTIPTIYNVDRD